MGTCNWCNKSGIFVFVNKDSLCGTCEKIVYIDVQQRLRIITESQELIMKSKKLDTKLSRLDLIIEHAKALLRYEEKNIRVIKPLPSQIIEAAESDRESIIIDGVRAEVEKIMTKANLSTTHKAKINQATKALEKVIEGKNLLLENASKLDTLEKELKVFIHKVQLDTYLEAAKKAEFKGQKKKAIDQYQEALYFLQNDDIDTDIQKDEMKGIEKKIRELQEE